MLVDKNSLRRSLIGFLWQPAIVHYTVVSSVSTNVANNLLDFFKWVHTIVVDFVLNKITSSLCFQSTFRILDLHPRDDTAMLLYKTIENDPTNFA